MIPVRIKMIRNRITTEGKAMSEARRRPPLATPKEVAHFRRTTEASLAQERYKGTGPRFKKLGKRVFYDWNDVYAWIDAHTMTRTDDRPVSA